MLIAVTVPDAVGRVTSASYTRTPLATDCESTAIVKSPLCQVVDCVYKTFRTKYLATIQVHTTYNVSKAVRVTICFSLVDLLCSSNSGIMSSNNHTVVRCIHTTCCG